LSSPAERPTWKTGTLWGVLAVLLGVGTLGAATFAFGVVGVASGNLADAIAIVVGAVVGVLAFLFIAGILYRVDRYRGTPQRRVELFE
jgi:hypothetical protein